MNYGFVIDNRKCIGCHACSVACKAENQVPVGAHRTWLKYVEKGEFPDTRRLFSVTRCNHCANPPCVHICPVTALNQRADGIVDLDQDRCIGCKACMQACPYDALYIHPDKGTAQKCHYCAHRVEKGLEPPCVIVCPTHAIVSGDMDDTGTEIAQLLAREQTTVRKPEQGTKPKLYYVGGDAAVLTPAAAPPQSAYMWGTPLHAEHGGFALAPASAGTSAGAGAGAARGGGTDVSGAHGGRWIGPAASSGTTGNGGAARGLGVVPPAVATASTFAALAVPPAPLLDFADALRGTYPPARRVSKRGRLFRAHDVGHEKPWGPSVSAYIFTKSIAAGAFLVAALAVLAGHAPEGGDFQLVACLVSMLFAGITAALLVLDLERPERFLTILIRPQWRSWLAIGSFILTGYGGLLGLWLAAHLLGFDALRALLLWPGVPLAVASAVYTAFLFAQAKGRNFWQSPAVAPGLLLHALVGGAAVLLPIAALVPSWAGVVPFLAHVLVVALALDLLVVFAELWTPHATADAEGAARLVVRGRYASIFWVAVVLLGHVLAATLVAAALPAGAAAYIAGAVLAALGMAAWNHCWVEAGQALPLS